MLVPLLLLVGACGALGDPRVDDADRVAQTVADAISYPRQTSADGFARAAAATSSARSGRLAVVEVHDLVSRDAEDPFARLVLRIHYSQSHSTGFAFFGSSDQPPLDVCYDVELGRYGVVGSPSRRDCPLRTTPVVVPPAPPVRKIPVGSDEAVSRVLRRLPADVDGERVRAAVVRSLPAAAPHSLEPEVQASTDGTDVGVSVRGEGDCLLGSRIGGQVLVWRPSWEQVQPGELSCDPTTALGRLGVTPPH